MALTTKEEHWGPAVQPDFDTRSRCRDDFSQLDGAQDLLEKERAQEPGEGPEPDQRPRGMFSTAVLCCHGNVTAEREISDSLQEKGERLHYMGALRAKVLPKHRAAEVQLDPPVSTRRVSWNQYFILPIPDVRKVCSMPTGTPQTARPKRPRSSSRSL